MRYDYYLHRSGGRVFDYFGGIGRPYRVNVLWWWVMKLAGYKATKVPVFAPIRRVYIRATLAQGAHRRSYKMEKILKEIYDEV